MQQLYAFKYYVQQPYCQQVWQMNYVYNQQSKYCANNMIEYP